MNLHELNTKALQLASEDGRLEDAKDAKEASEDELFALVIEAIKPALPALSSLISDPSLKLAGPLKRALLVVQRETRSLYVGEEGDWFSVYTDFDLSLIHI